MLKGEFIFRRVGIAHHSLQCPSTTRPQRVAEGQGPGRRTASIAVVKSSINSLLTPAILGWLSEVETNRKSCIIFFTDV